MPKRNLIFLTLLISVLMVSVVSAGITGYLVSRGGGIAEAGYIARLEKVEGNTAIVSVQTPTGATKIVQVEEGKTATVGNAQISASDLTEGTLFTRGKAEVGIDVGSADEEKCSSYHLSSKGGTNTFTINGQPVGIGFTDDGFFFSANQGPESNIISYSFQVGGSINFLGQIITILDIDKEGRRVKIKVCSLPEKPTEPPTGGQCVTQNCEWRFTDSVVNPVNAPGVGATAWCKAGEIVFEGSCNGDAAYSIISNNVAGILQAPGAPGSGWTCNYDIRPNIAVGNQYTLETGALCCSV